MYPQSHFLFSFLVASIFVKFGVFDWRVALFVAIFAVVIDVDHFLNFAFKRDDYNLKDAWNGCVVRHFIGRTFIHHWIGFIVMTAIVVGLYYWNMTWFWIIGLGYYTHMILDYAKINILKIKGVEVIREAGFVMRLNKFEAMFDIFLIIGIVLLYL